MKERLVEQALHGYRSGHRLLASSVDLATADKRLLAIVTDSPDVGRNPEWTALFVGHPLPSGEWFALSMTWAADQNSRPGAVVTHTLLLDPATIAVADRLDVLSLFARPHSVDDARRYAEALPVDVADRPCVTGIEPWAAEINWALHEPPPRPVEIVTTESQGKRHELLLRIWLELWPELRATWTFAEAPSARKAGFSSALDLQITYRPHGAAAEGTRVVAAPLPRNPPRWATALATLERGATASVHDFLDQYGPETRIGRESISSLSEIWTLIDGSSLSAAIERLATTFPQREDVVRLKTDLLSGHSPVGVAARISASSTIALAIETHSGAFDASETIAAVREAVRAMDSKSLLLTGRAALATRDQTALTTGVIDALAERVVTGDIREVADLIAPLARRHPEVATSPDSWRHADTAELWDAVRPARGQKLRRTIIASLLESQEPISAGEVARAWPSAYNVVLDAVANRMIHEQSATEWLEAAPSDQVGKWLVALAKVDLDRVTELIPLLGPQLVVALKPDQLRALAARSDAAPAALVAAFFAALEDESPDAAETAINCYQRLYALAIGEALGDARRQLDEADVDVPFWDAAQRLARLLSEGFKARPWPLQPIMTLDREPFVALISADAKAGLARRLLAADDVRPSPWQQAVLSDVIASRADPDGLRDALISLFSRVKPF